MKFILMILIGLIMNNSIGGEFKAQTVDARIERLAQFESAGIWFRIEFINSSIDYACINAAPIGLGGEINNNVFKIERDGDEVPFKGIMQVRTSNNEAPMIMLAPNGRLSVSVNISNYYDFSKPGTYKIAYEFLNISECNRVKFFTEIKSNQIQFVIN